MAKIYIALVGGQPYPVYLGLMDYAPDRVVFVHSEKSKKEAERIMSLSNISDVQFCEMLPVSLDDANRKIKKIKSKIQSSDQVVINISSGTKVWTYVFIAAFMGAENVEFCYVDQNCQVYMLKADEVHNPELEIDIDTALALNRTQIESCIEFEYYEDDDFDAIEDLKEVRRWNYDAFQKLTQMEDEKRMDFNQHEIGVWNYGGSTMRYDRTQCFVVFSMMKKDGKMCIKTVSSPHLFDILFNYAWFELEVADILSRWNKANEVLLNVKFPYNNKSPKNEIDILINTGERLLFVECKTQIFDITDLDKFRTAVKNYGGMGCKALFVTQAPMKETAREKCEDSDILCFSLENYHIDEQGLYDLLDSEIYKINKK